MGPEGIHMAANRVNPFKPTAGANPPLLVGRQDVLCEWKESHRDGPGAPGRITVFTGARGVGKTVMLNEVGELSQAQAGSSVTKRRPEVSPTESAAQSGHCWRNRTRHRLDFALPCLREYLRDHAVTLGLTDPTPPGAGRGLTGPSRGGTRRRPGVAIRARRHAWPSCGCPPVSTGDDLRLVGLGCHFMTDEIRMVDRLKI